MYHHIYTNHTNNLFWIQKGNCHQEATSLPVWKIQPLGNNFNGWIITGFKRLVSNVQVVLNQRRKKIVNQISLSLHRQKTQGVYTPMSQNTMTTHRWSEWYWSFRNNSAGTTTRLASTKAKLLWPDNWVGACAKQRGYSWSAVVTNQHQGVLEQVQSTAAPPRYLLDFKGLFLKSWC